MSPQKLERFIEKLGEEALFDLLIIGGGITGSALAYEAASRGLSVALVEKEDFGGATSSATGKLIHGGLRYLKRFDLSLVREALKERRILSNIAPNLVYPYPMILPDPGLLERVGLFVYDLLSFDRNWTWDRSKKIPAHKILSKKEIKNRGLAMDSAIYFYDCIMPNPERLTLAFLKSAVQEGASVSNYTKAEELIFEGNRVIGAVVQDVIHNKNVKLKASVIVNASGPWSQDFLNGTKKIKVPVPKTRSEGIYLITKKYFDTMVLHVGKKGHFSFAPWRGKNMIGPTEKAYYGPVEDWKLSSESILEFLEYINSSGLLSEKLELKDVEFAYGGLRPLAETGGEDKETYSASRKSELQDHSKDRIEGLISAGGGKYTTSRHFAEKIFKLIRKKSSKKVGPNVSKKKFLKGCEIPDIQSYLEKAKTSHPDFPKNTIEYLVRHYGTEYESILELADSSGQLSEVLDEDGELAAQVLYAIRFEMAMNLQDIFLRRTGLGTVGLPTDEVISKVVEIAGKEWRWTNEKKSEEIQKLKRRLKVPVSF
ncbi:MULTISPECIES: glycerol-3-phosphate dehydrogenase/oxidase [unclassified Leptospira]|uniref:glycerol-3-phosphate dehydrogenase/oxidase n=1 Tax=unclassified Leptospira TaxID=2633828 RepID=UPI0002BE1E42|nr:MULTISPECIES: glycerol-3-phosphate dehydrogenase/oxidase [unclassified Leptospira]EMK01632.1 FAD dependent oxidoreductase [Leptospira sp. B5-022]MCR1795255.1 glycerol-3-phosphate dehydrogenase/oxidase [Leptospira sp. id769339]